MTSDRITVEMDPEEYADVRVDGHPVASVDLKDGKVSVKAHDPHWPNDAAGSFVFDIPEDDDD